MKPGEIALVIFALAMVAFYYIAIAITVLAAVGYICHLLFGEKEPPPRLRDERGRFVKRNSTKR